ncbi:MAG: hypothetical protein LQ342_001728 [Letrouitia transgressa]|nr:MAG: hypothetical protein LQ342_001728 [Letrouitia transgressa]
MAPLFAYHLDFAANDIQDARSCTPMTQKEKFFTNYDSFPDANLDEELDFFNNTGVMAGTGNSSPFIKDEPDDYAFQAQNFAPNQSGPDMQIGHQFGDGAGGIDPSELTMHNGNFGQYNMGQQQNMSNSFNLGNSFVNDDELLELEIHDPSMQQNQFQGGQQGFQQQANANMQNHFHQSQQGMNGQNQMNQMYSNTPESAPQHSPFIQGNFNYAQYQMSHTSPHVRPVQGASLDSNYVTAGQRASMTQPMERQLSSSRSPMTPKTPGVGGLNLGTPESGSLPSQPIHSNFNQHRHQKSLSNQWDSTSGSLYSHVDSPMSSPGHPANHAQISEILKSGKHASLPAKVDSNHQAVPPYQTQEAKRRRRRESHNMVERRRRDNINERIQELSHLVPLHRLEDEKVRKHIVNNSPLSPTLAATGRSPPQATSLLAAGGRRATTAGSISMGIPLEEKDKGPNKGDILNGAVSWTRDLMWALYIKLQQESELADLIHSLGGRFPYEQTEDEKRMRSELLSAMTDNDPNTFSYSRGPGSGLRVPNHTNHAGDALNQGQMGTLSPQSLSPGMQSGGSGANSGGHGQPQFWSHLKEEDEYGMEMN